MEHRATEINACTDWPATDRTAPYGPELTPTERVFEEVRCWTEGTVYPCIEDKVKAAEGLLSELKSDPDRVRTLAGRERIEEAIQHLPTLLAA